MVVAIKGNVYRNTSRHVSSESMQNYTVMYYKKQRNSEAQIQGPYVFSINARGLEKAGLGAARELAKVGFDNYKSQAWKAYIKTDEESKAYHVLKKGKWLINFKTGRKLSNLEDKVMRD